MVTDYDTPLMVDSATDVGDLGDVKVRGAIVTVIDDLEAADDEPMELPGAEPWNEELVVQVVPRRADEFTCAGCFLVQHKSRAARRTGGDTLCPECA